MLLSHRRMTQCTPTMHSLIQFKCATPCCIVFMHLMEILTHVFFSLFEFVNSMFVSTAFHCYLNDKLSSKCTFFSCCERAPHIELQELQISRKALKRGYQLSLRIVFLLPLHLMRSCWLSHQNEQKQLGVCAPNTPHPLRSLAATSKASGELQTF